MAQLFRVREHIPPYVDGVEPKVDSVANTAELLALSWVDNYKATDFGEPFLGFFIAPDPPTLIAQYERTHWVIGFLARDGPWELPAWPGPRSNPNNLIED